MSIRVKHIAAPLAGLLAVLLVSGCSSKNPDSLIGMNVDENAAMMEANASSEGGATAAANGSEDNEASASAARRHAVQPSAAASARAEEEPSADANATGTENAPAADESNANQLGNGEDPPNPDGAPSA